MMTLETHRNIARDLKPSRVMASALVVTDNVSVKVHRMTEAIIATPDADVSDPSMTPENVATERVMADPGDVETVRDLGTGHVTADAHGHLRSSDGDIPPASQGHQPGSLAHPYRRRTKHTAAASDV